MVADLITGDQDRGIGGDLYDPDQPLLLLEGLTGPAHADADPWEPAGAGEGRGSRAAAAVAGGPGPGGHAADAAVLESDWPLDDARAAEEEARAKLRAQMQAKRAAAAAGTRSWT